MFDSLSDRFDSVFRKFRGQDKLSESNVKEAVREVRLALLEADVNYKVVKDFVGQVKERALGEKIVQGVTADQFFKKIVQDELVAMIKGVTEEGVDPERPFVVQPGKLNIIMMLGLQGAGKTTFCGKLAYRLNKEGCKPMLVACDVYRPAAVEQLKTVGGSLGFPVFERGVDVPVAQIVEEAIEAAKDQGRDVLILDTAGRLHIDEVKIEELVGIRDKFQPDYTFLVADAMTGQDAVNSAETFHQQVGIDGVCLTKMDGDARGGAALSIKAVTGRPIVFMGVGEKPDDLETFRAEGIADRILGMGDVYSLVEKAQQHIDEKEAQNMQEKLLSGNFSYDDFMKQMRMVKKMGSLKGLMSMVPGMGKMMNQVDGDMLEKELGKFEAIIQSMTKAEREDGDLLRDSRSRRLRVARGSGIVLRDSQNQPDSRYPEKHVDQMVNQFEQMKAMMAQMGGGGGFPGMGGGMGGLGGLLGAGGGGNMMDRMKSMMGMGGGGAEGMGGMPPMPPPGTPGLSKRQLRAQKMMLKQQERELAATQPKKKKDRKKNKKNKKRR